MNKHVQPPLYISTICNIRHCKACLNTDQAANERVISYYDALYICSRLSHGCKVRSDEVQLRLATGRACTDTTAATAMFYQFVSSHEVTYRLSGVSAHVSRQLLIDLSCLL